MLKALLKLLYFIAVSVIVILPLAGSLLSLKHHKVTHHTSIVNGIKCHEAHIDHDAHANHWDMVKNKQLSRPPAPVKVRNLVAAGLLLTLIFLGFSFHPSRQKSAYLCYNTALLPVTQKYLHHRMLLI